MFSGGNVHSLSHYYFITQYLPMILSSCSSSRNVKFSFQTGLISLSLTVVVLRPSGAVRMTSIR